MIKDKIQKIHTAISILPNGDIDRLIDFAELLKTVQEKQTAKSVIVDKEYISKLEDLINESRVRIESLRTALDSLFHYFMYDGTQLNDDLKQEILETYDTNRRMCNIALDYAISAYDLNKASVKLINDMRKESRGCTD